MEKLVIPSIEVNGHRTEFVKAVILSESLPGIDGSLGLSFLSRFNFSIIKDTPQRLLLKPIEKNGVAGVDVFICHKSADYPHARKVHDILVKVGRTCFLSEVSLPASRTTEFHKAIDIALENASHLAVICSSVENISAPWVEAEWRLFDGLKRSGKKPGNIILNAAVGRE